MTTIYHYELQSTIVNFKTYYSIYYSVVQFTTIHHS